jgi:hypothetical protein
MGLIGLLLKTGQGDQTSRGKEWEVEDESLIRYPR